MLAMTHSKRAPPHAPFSPYNHPTPYSTIKDASDDSFEESTSESEEEEEINERREQVNADLPSEYWQIQKLVKYLKVGLTPSTVDLGVLYSISMSAPLLYARIYHIYICVTFCIVLSFVTICIVLYLGHLIVIYNMYKSMTSSEFHLYHRAREK